MNENGIRAAYDQWPRYNERLRDVVVGLSEADLALDSGFHEWPVWAVVGHTACQRVFWLCDFAGEPGADTTPFPDASHHCPGDDDLDRVFTSTELVEALDTSFAIVERALGSWTVPMLPEVIHRPEFGDGWRHSRSSVLQRVFSHDVYHCAQLNVALGVAGLPQIDLWD